MTFAAAQRVSLDLKTEADVAAAFKREITGRKAG